MKILLRVILVAFLLAISSARYGVAAQQSKVRDYRIANEHSILEEFVTLLSLPNVASDHVNIRRNAALIIEMMKRRGLEPRLLEAGNSTVPPAVYGEWKVPRATRTIILYAHYDGQPTDPKQ